MGLRFISRVVGMRLIIPFVIEGLKDMIAFLGMVQMEGCLKRTTKQQGCHIFY
jgi:hypothetical protein